MLSGTPLPLRNDIWNGFFRTPIAPETLVSCVHTLPVVGSIDHLANKDMCGIVPMAGTIRIPPIARKECFKSYGSQ